MKTKQDIQNNMEKEFQYLKTERDESFFRFYDNEILSLKEKEDILIYFIHKYLTYDFHFTNGNTAILFERKKKENE